MPRSARAHTAVRLRDIAEMAGVSVNTVSRALNDKPDVSAKTRARVCALAERLGYSRNLLARSLVDGRTHTVGLVVTDCTDPFYASLIRAIEAVTSQNGFALLLATSNEDSEKERLAISVLRDRRVDGLLLTAVDADADHVRQLTRRDLPVVLLNRSPRGYKGSFVGTDNVRGARMAVRHLLDLGHRRIAHITRSDSGMSSRQRLEGYQRELESAGLGYDPGLVRAVAPTSEGGREGASWLLGLDPRPSAVFAYSDFQAAGVVAGLREAKVPVPRSVAVVGFDNIGMATLMEPPLTTVAQPIHEIGTLGANLLIDEIRGQDTKRPSGFLPPVLIVRGSTSPAGQG